MHALAFADAAGGIADSPAHGVAGRDRPRTDKLLAFLQCDVGDLSGGSVDLEQRAIGPGIFLDGVEEGRALGLDARRVVRAADLRALLERVEHPNCMAQLDFYHMARQGLDLPDCIARLAGRIGHVQFADSPGRGAPGTGEVDFPAALQALQASGYQGWLGAEYKPGEEGTQASLGWLVQWQQCT